MGDMMVLAFQTDVTRIATFMIANAGSNRSYSFIGINEGHHQLSHHQSDPEKLDKISRINRFPCEPARLHASQDERNQRVRWKLTVGQFHDCLRQVRLVMAISTTTKTSQSC